MADSNPFEKEALKILVSKTSTPIKGDNALEYLRSGVVLCKYINTIQQNIIPKISTRPLPFLQMENINNFLGACRDLGVPPNDLFDLFDLYDAKDLNKVFQTILSLSKISKGEVSHAIPKQKSTPKLSKPSLPQAKVVVAPPLLNIQESSEPDFADKAKQNQLESNIKAVTDFLETKLGESLPSNDLKACLKDGVLLCKLVNIIRPNSIPTINTKSLPFLQMENIHNFLEAVKLCGVQDHELFQTTDLYEGRDMQQVVVTLLALMRISGHGRSSGRKDTTLSSIPRISSLEEPNEVSKKLSSVSISDEKSSPSSTEIVRSKSKKGKKKSSKVKLSSDYDLEQEAVNTRISMFVPGGDNVEFQLGDCIGRGHFGSVHKGLNLATGEIVAVKRIKLNDENIKELSSMMKEVELLSSLDHPNIVRYEGFVQTEGFLNIVLEFVENGSLYHTLKQFGAFPEKLVTFYTVGILEGLNYLHNRNVIHCDLKAANILSTKQGTIKLSDFGVSKQFSFDVTDTSVAGTPNWMAPEIIELKGATTASDIWSLGCTLIELLVGKPPYSDCNPMTVLFKIVEDDRPPIPENLSSDMKDFLITCFCKEPEKRPTASDLLKLPWLVSKSRSNTIRSGNSDSLANPSPSSRNRDSHTSFKLDENSKVSTQVSTTSHFEKEPTKISNAADTDQKRGHVEVKITTSSLQDEEPVSGIKSSGSQSSLHKKLNEMKSSSRKVSSATTSKSTDELKTNTLKGNKLRRKTKSGESECIIS